VKLRRAVGAGQNLYEAAGTCSRHAPAEMPFENRWVLLVLRPMWIILVPVSRLLIIVGDPPTE